MGLTESLQRAIESPEMKWECATPDEPMAHFTGRQDAAGWVIQLVCLGSQRMGAASRGLIVLKLTDEQCELAEKKARVFFVRKELDRIAALQPQGYDGDGAPALDIEEP